MSNRRRFGNVRLLRSGRWQARYKGMDGRTYKAPSTFANKTDALRFLVEIESSMMRNEWLDPATGNVTLRAYGNAWLQNRVVKGKPLKPRTIEAYEHSLRTYIEPTFGTLPMSKIRPEAVRTWHANLSRITGPAATRQAYALLKAILNTAVQDQALIRNPCLIRGAGVASGPERPLLSVEDVSKLHAAMPEHYRSLVLVTLHAHLRIGEALGLRRKDLDLKAGTLTVANQQVETSRGPLEGEPKHASYRTVHLPSQAVTVLLDHFDAIGTPMLPNAKVWTRPDGQPLRAHHLHAAWNKARVEANLPTARFHDLRHAGLTLLAQQGASLREIMARAGHSTQRAAMIYQHAAEDRDALLATRLSEATQGHFSGMSGTQVARTVEATPTVIAVS